MSEPDCICDQTCVNELLVRMFSDLAALYGTIIHGTRTLKPALEMIDGTVFRAHTVLRRRTIELNRPSRDAFTVPYRVPEDRTWSSRRALRKADEDPGRLGSGREVLTNNLLKHTVQFRSAAFLVEPAIVEPYMKLQELRCGYAYQRGF